MKSPQPASEDATTTTVKDRDNTGQSLRCLPDLLFLFFPVIRKNPILQNFKVFTFDYM